MAISHFSENEQVVTTGLNILHAILSGPGALTDDEEISTILELLFRILGNNISTSAIVSRIFMVFCLMLKQAELHAKLYASLAKAIPVVLQHNGNDEDTVNALAYFLYLVFKKFEDISEFENDGVLDAILKHCREHSDSSLIMVLVGYMVVYDYGSLRCLAADALSMVKSYMVSHYESWFAIRAINFLIQDQIPTEVQNTDGYNKILNNLTRLGPEESDQKLLRESCRFFKILAEKGLLKDHEEVIKIAKDTLLRGIEFNPEDPDLKYYFIMIKRFVDLIEALGSKLDEDEFYKLLNGPKNNGLLQCLRNSVSFEGDFDAAMDTLLYLARNPLTKQHFKGAKQILEFVRENEALFPNVEYKALEILKIAEH